MESSKVFANYLFPNRHADFNFLFEIDNSIKGRILDPNGKPLESIGVSLIPIGGEKSEYFFRNEYSKETGDFNIKEIPVGKYMLAVNKYNRVSFKTPFRRLYYPSVHEVEKAAIISINEGEHIEGIELRIPKFEEIITVEGQVLYSNGTPVAKERVFFTSETSSNPNNIEGFAITDPDGRFTLELMKGLKGNIYGIITALDDEIKTCPSLEKFSKERSKNLKLVNFKSDETPFQANENTTGIELKFNFTRCEQVKD